jgi:IS1 family transposase
MANVTKTETQKLAIRLLCEGNSIRSTSRITGCHKGTIGKLILAFGQAAKNLMDERLHDLSLRHVEVDEVWSFVKKKQARLTIEEKETCGTMGDIYLWTALDQDSGLIASYAVGKRSADMARRLMVDLAGRINLPNPHASDDHAYAVRRHDTVIQISTDGFSAYREAIDLAFGPYAAHGVLIKEYRNATMQYTPSEMVGTDRRVINGNIDEWSICTSHVERHNLTIRTFMKRFTRLSLGFSKSFEHHAAAVALFLAYYNFVWRSRYSDDSGKAGKLRTPAAMRAGVVDTLWSFDTFFQTVNQYQGTAAW